MRVTIMVVPPVVSMLHADLGLTHTDIGLLSGLPPVLFALASVPGALLVARVGAKSTLVTGLLITGVASALRAVVSGRAGLFASTAAMGLGTSILQPAMPQLVRTWLPERVGFGTALYMNGLLIGEILAVGLMRPVVLPLAGGSWRVALVLWAVPVGLIALAVLLAGPRVASGTTAVAGRSWWPRWSDPRVWRLGFMLGSINGLYFATNFFIPDYLAASGHRELVDSTLTMLNLGQVPASLIMLAFTGRWLRRRAAYVASGALSLAGLVGMVAAAGPSVPYWAALMGFASTVTFVLAFALPSLLAEPHDVHRVAAGMFTVSYSCAVVTPVIGGWLWALTGIPVMAFAPILMWPFVTALMALRIDFRPPAG